MIESFLGLNQSTSVEFDTDFNKYSPVHFVLSTENHPHVVAELIWGAVSEHTIYREPRPVQFLLDPFVQHFLLAKGSLFDQMRSPRMTCAPFEVWSIGILLSCRNCQEYGAGRREVIVDVGFNPAVIFHPVNSHQAC